jgi:hypothetical protein
MAWEGVGVALQTLLHHRPYLHRVFTEALPAQCSTHACRGRRTTPYLTDAPFILLQVALVVIASVVGTALLTDTTDISPFEVYVTALALQVGEPRAATQPMVDSMRQFARDNINGQVSKRQRRAVGRLA